MWRITTRIHTAMAWVGKALSEENGSPSTKRILFALVTLYSLGIVTGIAAIAKSLSPECLDLLKTLIYATGGAYAVGRFAEGKPNE